MPPRGTPPTTTDVKGIANGLAALAICEALLLTLIENKSLSDNQACSLLADAATAHRQAPAGQQKSMHEAVAAAIEVIRKQVSVAAALDRADSNRNNIGSAHARRMNTARNGSDPLTTPRTPT